MRRVVITGIGPICSLGTDHEEVFSRLCSKEQVKKRLDKNNPARQKIKAEWYVPYPDIYSDGKYADKLAQTRKNAVKSAYAAAKAALIAMDDAGLDKADDDTMVIVGTDSFSMEEIVEETLKFDKTQKLYSMMIPYTIQSAIASWVTIALGVHGMSSVINMACASSTTSVGICYENRTIINGVDLKIPERTTTAIVGPSGGGKTTLTNLMARFWDVQSGEVFLGGKNVKDYSFDSLMRNFSFVFQRVYLFEDTIANNIRFGEPDAPIEKVIEAAKKARCHDFIMSLPDGYDTVIGEGGASLSGGEKQRISIARAIMKDSPVIILDEATANVDPENEAELTKAIEELTKEKTIIMIAHRLKTVEHADQIIVIDGGRIVQQGKHAELMQQDGIYRTFVTDRQKAASWKL